MVGEGSLGTVANVSLRGRFSCLLDEDLGLWVEVKGRVLWVKEDARGMPGGSGLEDRSTKLYVEVGSGVRDFDESIPNRSFGASPNGWPEVERFGWSSGLELSFADVGFALMPGTPVLSSRSTEIPQPLVSDPAFSGRFEVCPLLAAGSSPWTALILLATSHPSSVNAYFLNGLPFS